MQGHRVAGWGPCSGAGTVGGARALGPEAGWGGRPGGCLRDSTHPLTMDPGVISIPTDTHPPNIALSPATPPRRD